MNIDRHRNDKVLVTSAEATKYLKKLNDERDALLHREYEGKTFLAAVGEDLEDARPQYDYAQTQKELHEIYQEIRNVKHALNKFNTETVVPGFSMTIDEMLVYLPQLHQERDKLFEMKNALPKVRKKRPDGKLIEYVYANYEIAAAAADFEKVDDLLTRAQTALDKINNTETLKI